MIKEGCVVVKKIQNKSQKRGLVIVVSKLVSKKAVTRNLIKRRIRVIVRLTGIKANQGIMIITKPAAAKVAFRELKNEIETKIKDITTNHVSSI